MMLHIMMIMMIMMMRYVVQIIGLFDSTIHQMDHTEIQNGPITGMRLRKSLKLFLN